MEGVYRWNRSVVYKHRCNYRLADQFSFKKGVTGVLEGLIMIRMDMPEKPEPLDEPQKDDL
jgi:hypothetical protein